LQLEASSSHAHRIFQREIAEGDHSGKNTLFADFGSLELLLISNGYCTKLLRDEPKRPRLTLARGQETVQCGISISGKSVRSGVRYNTVT
jgi:hypothetical protein